MKTIFIIKYNDFSATVKEEYKTKKEADTREKELYKMGALKEIKCFWIEPKNKPWERKRVDF